MRVKLKDVATYINGKAFKPSEWVDKGLPIIRIQNLNDPTKEYNYYDKEVDKKYIIQDGDILISWSATLDIFEWKSEKALLNQHIFKVVFDKDIELDKNYFKLAISSVLHAMERYTHGSTMKHIVKKDFENIEIPLPPLPKQKAIAKKLDLAQKLIDLRKQSITKLDELSKSVFVEMFGDPVENEMGWEVVKLGDVVKIDAPMVEPKDEKYENLLHIGPDRIEKNTGKLLPALTAKEENLISKKFLFNEEYLLYSKIRPYLNKVAMVDFVGLCSADMYPLKPIANKLKKEYLWQLLLSPFFIRYTETLPDRASIPKLNRKELAKFEFNLPPLPLQNKFAKTIQAIEAQKALYAQELVKLEESFSGLLQESFT